ncbi:sensor histidine kinase [Parvibium lacunae]|uniref:histidine kinase n=1 Tax=Parvibium lacunae TaxID=1888893 RepID=A0A368L7W0_9BURK|nr:HAMP domain-containing sensor histidine kinase [Parvibium lacunae]RCS59697.1 sensor histidine kinase [Parvibium lacunae]
MIPSKLLLRQLKRAFGLSTEDQFQQFITRLRHYDVSTFPRDVGMLLREFEHFLTYIDQTYTQHDRDMHLRTRSLDLTSQELLQKNQEIQTYSNAISHDLRIPLRAISGYTGELINNLSQQESKESTLDHFLFKIQHAVADMELMINSLLQLANQQHELRKQVIDLTALTQDVIQTLRTNYPESEINFTVQSGLSTDADPVALREILQNLLSNAVKFSQSQVHPKIEIGQKNVADSEPAETTVFYVKDNGLGFPADQIARLFQPFQKLHVESGLSGYGIGLATTQHLIRRHGGKIWAENNPEGGACFYFTLSN